MRLLLIFAVLCAALALAQMPMAISNANDVPSIPRAKLMIYYDMVQGADNQVVYDRSGLSNHGRMGSTSGVDANDPVWVTNGLQFTGGNKGVWGSTAPAYPGGVSTNYYAVVVVHAANTISGTQTLYTVGNYGNSMSLSFTAFGVQTMRFNAAKASGGSVSLIGPTATTGAQTLAACFRSDGGIFMRNHIMVAEDYSKSIAASYLTSAANYHILGYYAPGNAYAYNGTVYALAVFTGEYDTAGLAVLSRAVAAEVRKKGIAVP
jgi:hypothetical protein